ncbi:MAG: hypothetical protein ACRDRQ_00645 [Pseudonocardiaceae bacterium]
MTGRSSSGRNNRTSHPCAGRGSSTHQPIRVTITKWPQTLRLVSLLAAATGPAALIVLLIMLLRP